MCISFRATLELLYRSHDRQWVFILDNKDNIIHNYIWDIDRLETHHNRPFVSIDGK